MATTSQITILKTRLVAEDIDFDTDGGGGIVSVPTSNGGSNSGRRINASHIPITTATRAKKGADNVVVAEKNVDTLLQAILDELLSIGVPDGTTLTVTNGVLSIGAAIGTANIAADAITGAEIADDAVDTEHIVAQAVGSAELNSGSGTEAVATSNIRDLAVTAGKLADGAVTADKIPDTSIKAAKFADAATHFVFTCESVSSSDFAPTSSFTLSSPNGNFAVGDLVQATMIAQGTTGGDYIVTTAISAGTKVIEVTFDTALSVGTATVLFTVFRPVTA